MNASFENLLDFVKTYLKLGWHLFPLLGIREDGSCACGKDDCSNAGKHPKQSGGFKNATLESGLLQQWFTQKHTNVGIATGIKSNIFVLDIDAPHGGVESLNKLTEKFRDLPKTITVSTGHPDSRHHYFRMPNGFIVKNKIDLFSGIDIRGEGGYVVAPPSQHRSGKQYSWLEGCSPDEVGIAEAPQWLLDLIKSPPPPPNDEAPFGEKVGEGKRNKTLFKYGADLKNRGVDEHAIRAALHAKNKSDCVPPLPESEVESIVGSILKYVGEVLIWDEIQNLPPLEVEVPALSPDMIPESIRAWALDAANRMQTHVEMIVVAFLVTFSALIGRKLRMRPKAQDIWTIVVNLWGIIIGRPSTKKTPSMNEALSFLRKIEAEFQREYDRALFDFEIASQKQGKKKKGQEAEPSPELKPPVRKRILINDSTTEMLGIVLNQNPNGVLIFRDELTAWLKGLEKVNREGDRQFFLEAFNGDGSYNVLRVTRPSIDVQALCFSILGGMQPDVLGAYFRDTIQNGSSGDGLLSRFQLMIYPGQASDWKLVDQTPDVSAMKRVGFIFERFQRAAFDRLLGKNRGSGEDYAFLHFDTEAQEIFYQWLTKLENRLRSGETESPAFEAHLTKYQKLIPALALIFHVIDFFGQESFNDRMPMPNVSVASLKLAIRWGEFLEAHARKVYADANRPQVKVMHLLVEKIRQGKIVDGDTFRSITRPEWSGLKDAKLIRAALSQLQELNWVKVREVSPKGVGAPTEIIRLNPSLMKAGMV